MKKVLLMILSTMLLTVSANAIKGRIVFAKGKVMILQGSKWKRAKVNTAFNEGDTIKTQAGALAILSVSRSRIKLRGEYNFESETVNLWWNRT